MRSKFSSAVLPVFNIIYTGCLPDSLKKAKIEVLSVELRWVGELSE